MDTPNGTPSAPDPRQPSVPVHETRAARRQRRELERSIEAPPTVGRFYPVLAAVTVLAGLAIGLAGVGDAAILATVYGALCVVLAWGVPGIARLQPEWPITIPVAVAGLGAALAGAVTTQPPYLEFGPIALAGATVLACLLQLVRRDGRAGLTSSLASAGAGLAFVAMGACYLPVARNPEGPTVLWCVVAATVASLAADLFSDRDRLRVWLAPLALALGGLAGLVTAALAGDVPMVAGLLLGLFSAGAAFCVRRVATSVPAIETVRAQVAAALASMFAPGVVAYVVGRMFIG